MTKVENYINGNLVSYSTNTIDVENPSTGEKIRKVILSNEKDFELAINSSHKAFLEWSQVTPLKRS